jgi:hypothetical protein
MIHDHSSTPKGGTGENWEACAESDEASVSLPIACRCWRRSLFRLLHVDFRAPVRYASPGTDKPIPGTYQNLQRVVDASQNLSLELESLVPESLALDSRPVRLPRCRSPLCLCRYSCLCIRVCPFLHQPSSGERPPHGQRCSLHRHARPRIQLGGLQPPLQRSWPWMV